MTINKTTQRWLASAAIVTLAFAGCSKADTATNGGGTGDNKQIAASTNDMNAKDAKDVGQGGTLRLTNNAYPANWNVFSLDGNEANTNDMMLALYPSLVQTDAAGTYSANPQYTKRIEKKADSPLTIEIELKEGLKWSDGTPIDYKSIENAFKYQDGTHKEYQIASSNGYEKVSSIKQGANAQTAVVTFKENYADWMSLPAVMPDALVKDPATFNSGWVEKPLITAGPFKVDKLDPTNKTVSVVPDPAWTGDKPKLNRVLWTTVEAPAAAATSYKNGQLDAINAKIPAQYTVLKDLVGKGSELRKAAGPNWTHITLNGAKGRALSDQKVRQAVQHALKRDEIFQAVNAAMPYPKDIVQQNNHVLMTNQEGYKDNSGEFGKYDPEASKKLLTEAGYTITDGKAVKDGKQISVTYVYNDGSKTNEAVVPVVQEELKAIGIDMQVQKVPPTDLFAKYIHPGQFDLTLFGWQGTPALSSGDSIWKSTGEQNYGKVGDKAIDDLINKSAMETDKAKRLDEINNYDAKLWEQAGTIPLWQSYDFFIQDKDLANFGAAGFQSVDWTKVGYVTGSPKLNG